MFASPTVAVAISGMWVFVMHQLDNWLAERSLHSELKKAEIALAAIEADPNSSEKIRKQAREKVDALRMLKLTLHSNRAQAIVRA
jgi:tRNA U34 5-methylaminomethyl-2-thiouridine-forming methyltransferase MnmC